MTVPDYTQTRQTYKLEELSLSDNISSLIEKLSTPEYSRNSPLQKPIISKLVPLLITQN